MNQQVGVVLACSRGGGLPQIVRRLLVWKGAGFRSPSHTRHTSPIAVEDLLTSCIVLAWLTGESLALIVFQGPAGSKPCCVEPSLLQVLISTTPFKSGATLVSMDKQADLCWMRSSMTSSCQRMKFFTARLIIRPYYGKSLQMIRCQQKACNVDDALPGAC